MFRVLLLGMLASFPLAITRTQDQSRILGHSSQPDAEKRLALIIGNGAYANAASLRNPPNDARDMAKNLTELGFVVETGIDLNQKQMKAMIRQFGQRLKGKQGVFYYAGHGVQSKGRNYLIPVDALIESEADVEDAGVDIQLMLNYMDDAQNGLNIVILDACRNNPFARSIRSSENGLAQVDAPTGTLIAYATAPGRVASDGTGKNGLYTGELLKQMRTPGVSVTEMFMRVRAEVVKQTAGKQVPWEASSLIGTFFFNATTNIPTDPKGKPSVMPADAELIEKEYWESIKNSKEKLDYQEYLNEFPQGRYAQLARLRLRQWETAKNLGNNASGIGAPTNENKVSGPAADALKAAPRAGEVVRNQLGIEMIYVPAGEFMMGLENGDTSEKPVRRVTIDKGFFMGRYEVTQAQWQQVMGKNPSPDKRCAQCPANNMPWNDAQQFIRKLNALNDGYTYRLPSEAEWEYSCRAGTTGDFAGDLDSLGWYDKNTIDTSNGLRYNLQKVGLKQPNEFGLFDMHGNVAEWCEDVWHEDYLGAPSDGSAWTSGGKTASRVVRGGSFNNPSYALRSGWRSYSAADRGFYTFGIRIVAVPRALDSKSSSTSTPQPIVTDQSANVPVLNLKGTKWNVITKDENGKEEFFEAEFVSNGVLKIDSRLLDGKGKDRWTWQQEGALVFLYPKKRDRNVIYEGTI
ncbi:MAG TPA: caspase family protein, partial [Pyrinomonadaceae bacterium]|nr:caspase family protein [Pyrinomonadaceae bacterium]